jgi:hypothetical protein
MSATKRYMNKIEIEKAALKGIHTFVAVSEFMSFL